MSAAREGADATRTLLALLHVLLSIEHVSKSFGPIRALDGITLKVGTGTFGLLGPNGAGKSTLMRIIATLLTPDRGTVRLDAWDVQSDPLAVRSHLGYLPQEFGLYPNVPVRETLDHFAALKGHTDPSRRRATVDAMLELVNLTRVSRQPAGSLSGGTRQRLGVAIALVGNPSLLVLDEPTAGLDPEERRRLYDLLAEIAAERIVIVSTHIVYDVEELCERLVIINSGRLLVDGEPRALVAELDAAVWEVEGDLSIESAVPLASRRLGGRRITRWFAREQPHATATSVPPSLEDVYFLCVRGER